MLVPVELAKVVDALTAIRIDFSPRGQQPGG